MRKTILLLVLMFCFFSLGHAGKLFHISITGNYMMPSDEGYKTIYGDSMIYPELETGVKLYQGLFIWLGYGYLNAKGTLPVIEDDATSSQHHLSAGAGYRIKITRFMELKLKLGSFNVYYIEKTLGDEEIGAAFGYRVDIGYSFYIGQRFFIGLSGGYIQAKKTINSNSVSFGGAKAGIEIGIRF